MFELAGMNAAEKGELYARIFRKVGVFVGKGEIPRALKALDEGMKIAERNGDSKMAGRFAQEIATSRRPPTLRNSGSIP